MDDLLSGLVVTLLATSSPSAPPASVLSQLAQSNRHEGALTWHDGAKALNTRKLSD
jgi:hypothetical protein